MLYDNLEGWDAGGVGGRFKRVRRYIYIYTHTFTYIHLWLIHVVACRNQHNTVKQLYSNKELNFKKVACIYNGILLSHKKGMELGQLQRYGWTQNLSYREK